MGLGWTGDLAEDSKDAALVALSFARAHAPWLKARYGFYIDPRQHKPSDYLFMIKGLERGVAGTSLGAALAGSGNDIISCSSVG
jgi:hypothetical protein